MKNGVLFSALAIRDTNPHTSAATDKNGSSRTFSGQGSGEGGNPFGKAPSRLAANPLAYVQLGEEEDMVFYAVNTCNQIVTVQFQGSFDGVTWQNLGSSFAVAATTGTAAQSLTDPWPKVQATATCSVSPGTGSFTLSWQSRRRSGID